jgi:hypothetical protein
MIVSALNESQKADLCVLLQIHRTPYLRGMKGVNGHGEIVCMAGFDQWTPNSCMTHLWIRRPGDLTRKFIVEVFRYLFLTCNLGVIYGLTPKSNAAALGFNEKLGWDAVLTVKDGYAVGVDLVLQVMRREDCRWIKGETSRWVENQVRQPHRTTWESPPSKESRTRH